MGNNSKLFDAVFNNVQNLNELTKGEKLRTIEKIIPPDMFRIKMDPEYNYSKDAYIIGSTYVLPGIKCEWGHMPGKEYVLKYIIKEIGGTKTDIVIMKQISGRKDTIFCLSRTDCETLGFEYEPELQIFHKDMDFKFKRGQEIKIDWNDLSTYPVNKQTLNVTNFHFLVELKNPQIHQIDKLLVRSEHIVSNSEKINETTHSVNVIFTKQVSQDDLKNHFLKKDFLFYYNKEYSDYEYQIRDILRRENEYYLRGRKKG